MWIDLRLTLVEPACRWRYIFGCEGEPFARVIGRPLHSVGFASCEGTVALRPHIPTFLIR